MELRQVETLYTSICASQRENNIKTSGSYLLFSSNRCPVIYHLKKGLATHLLGHTDEVNGACFINCIPDLSTDFQSERIWLVSTSYDGYGIIWEIDTKPEATDINYRIIYRFKSETKDSFCTRSSVKKADKFFTITTSIDGNLSLWVDDLLTHSTTIKYCCFNSLIHQVGDYLLLFLAGADSKVHIFQIITNQQTNQLKHLIDLVGHQDWIKSLDILNLEFQNEFLLASASQDLYVRVWHLRVVELKDIQNNSPQLRTNLSHELVTQTHSGVKPLSFKLTATLETVLSGHEGIVHGVCWFKKQAKPMLQLISCSADKTVIIWKSCLSERRLEPSESGGDDDKKHSLSEMRDESVSAELWREAQKMGETGETNLPFLSVCLSPDELTLYGQSLHGAIHSWTKQANNQWVPGLSITGHFGSVTDLAWDHSGSYLLSCSLDKTCRLHGIAKCDTTWHELARPQVHGHELNSVASVSLMKFATGAEEKTIRVFEATQFFIKNYKALSEVTEAPWSTLEDSQINLLPIHAQLPALGLSNRGAREPYDVDNEVADKAGGGMASNWYKSSKLIEQLNKIEHLKELPQEEVLLQSTLWWESNKLYGHGNELYALAVDSTASFIASASKANRPELAQILIWDISKFRKVASIEHHTLTVTKLRFSPDSKYLLSVSRDRTWCVSVKTGQLRDAYRKLIGTTKSHSSHDRIIWDCCWTTDSRYFLTVSRDERALLWSMDVLEMLDEPYPKEGIEPVSSKVFDSSIQAVDCCSLAPKSCYLFAFGFEGGSLELSALSMSRTSEQLRTYQWQKLKSFSHFHHLPIRRLTFKPPRSSSNENANAPSSFCLASGGDDCMVKLTRFTVGWGE